MVINSSFSKNRFFEYFRVVPCDEPNRKLLVIFTTFKSDTNRASIHQEVINNWSVLGDDIQPIFFYNKSEPNDWDILALEKGWIGLSLASTNNFGTPVLKEMYMKVTNKLKSEFYGFCNGDILFDQKIKMTLKHILNNKIFLRNSTMVIGQRTNIEVQDYYDYKKSNLNDTKSLSHIADARGSLFMKMAEDYFFIHSPENFPWHDIKDIVIGRRGYDNYLVSEAVQHNVSVIDATKTILAVHLTGSDGNQASLENIDREYNIDLIGERYNYSSGSTFYSQYYTEFGEEGDFIVKKRYHN